jgi:mannose-6-phosphate isomerase-like protein (cupin superfamily)
MGCSKKLTILSGGHPINLRRGNGTSSDVIDFVFSLMVLAAIRTDCKKLSKRVYHLDPAVENEMALLCETGGVSKQWIPTHLKKSQLKFDKRPYGGVFKFGNQVMERFSLARAVFTPGSETEGHYHLNSEEAYLIENGAANMTVWHYQHPENKTVYPVKAGDYFTIPRGFVHHVKVTSSTDFICLVVASPPFSFWDQFFETKGK